MKSNRDFLQMLNAQSSKLDISDSTLQHSLYNTNSLVGRMYEADKLGKDIRPYLTKLYLQELGRTL